MAMEDVKISPSLDDMLARALASGVAGFYQIRSCPVHLRLLRDIEKTNVRRIKVEDTGRDVSWTTRLFPMLFTSMEQFMPMSCES